MRRVSVVEEQRHLAVTVVANDVSQIAEIIMIHTDNVIIILILPTSNLMRTVSLASDAVLGKNTTGRRLDRITQFLCTRSGRGNLKFAFPARFLHHILEYILSHRTTTDIPMTDKQYLFHNAKLRKLSEMPIFLAKRHDFNSPLLLSYLLFAFYN